MMRMMEESLILLMKNINWLFLSVRNLPDVTLENFSKVDLRQFKWIHWEVSEGSRTISDHSSSYEALVWLQQRE